MYLYDALQLFPRTSSPSQSFIHYVAVEKGQKKNAFRTLVCWDTLTGVRASRDQPAQFKSASFHAVADAEPYRVSDYHKYSVLSTI